MLRAALLRVGFLVSALSFAYGIWSLIVKVTGLYEVPGWTSIVVAVTFLGGIQLIVLGVMGTYIADIHAEVKGRPLYVVGELENFDGVRSCRRGRSSRGRAPRFRRPKRMSRTDPREGRAAACSWCCSWTGWEWGGRGRIWRRSRRSPGLFLANRVWVFSERRRAVWLADAGHRSAGSALARRDILCWPVAPGNVMGWISCKNRRLGATSSGTIECSIPSVL